MTEQEALVLWNAIPGKTNFRIKKLVKHYGSARRAWERPMKELVQSGIFPPDELEKIIEFDRDNFLQNEYNLIQQFEVNVVTFFDEHYPGVLKNIPDAPVVLYVKGTLPEDQGMAFAIVGSRNASVYGLTIAEKFAARLAELGITVVSGLAKGIDTASHQGALRAGGKTVGVLGCGLSHIYPPENKALFQSVSQNGAVISEYPMAMPPIAYNFPPRNRIISGLSMATLVVEAALRSGALITSRYALEQGRDVFAVPGMIDHPNAQGVHQLIQQGAKLVTSFEDILQELEPQIRRLTAGEKAIPEQTEKPLPEDLSDEELQVVQALTENPVYIDQLAMQSGQPLAQVANILLTLELKKFVKQLPGQYFVRT